MGSSCSRQGIKLCKALPFTRSTGQSSAANAIEPTKVKLQYRHFQFAKAPKSSKLMPVCMGYTSPALINMSTFIIEWLKAWLKQQQSQSYTNFRLLKPSKAYHSQRQRKSHPILLQSSKLIGLYLFHVHKSTRPANRYSAAYHHNYNAPPVFIWHKNPE